MINPPDIEHNLRLAKSNNAVESNAGSHYLICRYTSMIHRLSYQICKECDIQDMVQSGQYAILYAIKTYNHSSSFTSWAYTQIRNELQKQRELIFPVKISRYLLKKGNKAEFTRQYDEIADRTTPVDHLINDEKQHAISDALRGLNRRYSKKECKIFSDYYFLGTKLITLSKRHHTNANAIIRKITLDLRSANYNKSS